MVDINNVLKQVIILADDPKAAEYRKDLEGWCANGFYYGKDGNGERRAREAGATHVKCPECDKVRVKDNWGVCESCRDKKYQQRFLDMPWKEWDGVTPLVIYGDDRFFFDEDDINSYLEDSEDESLQLCICEPVYARALRQDYWEDCFPDNDDDENVLPADLLKKIDEINEILAGMPPVSWKQGKFRTTYTYSE